MLDIFVDFIKVTFRASTEKEKGMELTQSQEDILQAAIKVIARKGYKGLTTNVLTKELKISEAELAHHFGSIDKLVETILEYFDDLSDLVMVEIENAELEPLEKIHRLILDRYHLFNVQRDLTMVMLSTEIFYYDRIKDQRISKIMRKHGEHITSCLKEAQAQGSVDPSCDPLQLFRIIVGSTKFLVSQWNLGGQKFDLVAEGEKLFQTIRKLIEVPQ